MGRGFLVDFDCLEVIARSSLATLESSLLRFTLILLDCREDSEASSQDLFKPGVDSLSAVAAWSEITFSCFFPVVVESVGLLMVERPVYVTL